MGEYSEAFVAFDVAKIKHAVAVAEGGRTGEVRFLGEIENREGPIERTVKKLAGRHGRLHFCFEAGPTGYGRGTDQQISEEARRLTPPVTHALVRAHPETGERSLYLDRTTTVGIDYMDTASGLALLDEVYESAIHDEFVYSHRWQIGDLVVWDNGFRCTGAHHSTQAQGAS